MAKLIVDAEYHKEIDKARRELRALIANKNCAPIMLQLAWHDAGTYDAETKTGGPNGSIRNEAKYRHDANSGLKIALDLCEEVKTKLPKISYADLYQLAGVVAVEVTGGPDISFVPGRKDSNACTDEGRFPDANQEEVKTKLPKINYADLYPLAGVVVVGPDFSFVPGRKDSNARTNEGRLSDANQEEVKTKLPKINYADLYPLVDEVAGKVTGGPDISFVPGRKDSNACTDEGRFPDAYQGFEHLKDVFYRTGLSDKDIVALSGAHAMGRAHPERSGLDGPWTQDPLKFDNSYFVELLKEEDSEGLLKIFTDRTFLEVPKFRDYVELYAKDEDAFFRDYAKSHKKLSELGFAPTSSFTKAITDSRVLGLSAVGVVVAAAVVVFCYFFEISRKMK